MTLADFIQKYGGQQLTNNSGGFLGECVSLAARYAQEVQGVPIADGVLYCSNTGGARDLYEQFDGKLPQFYDCVPNGQPRQAGDLVVWGSNLGHYGDVAVALDSGNRVFGQLGTPVFQPARIREENRPPLGYLRLKGGDMVTDAIATLAWVGFMDLPADGSGPINEGFNGFRGYWMGKPVEDMLKWLVSTPRHMDVVTKSRKYTDPDAAQKTLDQIKQLVK